MYATDTYVHMYQPYTFYRVLAVLLKTRGNIYQETAMNMKPVRSRFINLYPFHITTIKIHFLLSSMYSWSDKTGPLYVSQSVESSTCAQ